MSTTTDRNRLAQIQQGKSTFKNNRPKALKLFRELAELAATNLSAHDLAVIGVNMGWALERTFEKSEGPRP